MNTDNIIHMIHKLFPPGNTWVAYPMSVMALLIEGISNFVLIIQKQIETLVKNSFPSSAEELLLEWEKEYGIPDKIYNTQVSREKRIAQILTRYTFPGEAIIPNKAYYIELARVLGYTVTIDDTGGSDYFECGVSCAGDYLSDSGGSDICIVNVQGSAADGVILENVFNAMKHADNLFQFIYTE